MADEVKKKKEEGGAPRWMTTFADLMSLLMCFFVLLLSFSEMDKQKFKQVAGSMEKAFGIQREIPGQDSLEGNEIISQQFRAVPMDVQLQVRDALAAELEGGIAETDFSPDGMIVRIKGGVAFDSGKAMIREQFKGMLDKLGKIITEFDIKVIVSGHTDNIPLKEGADYETNWGLSAARAVKVVEYLSGKFKIPPNKLSAAGYAEGQPLADNESPQGRAKNRRVEFKIRPNQSDVAFDGLDIM